MSSLSAAAFAAVRRALDGDVDDAAAAEHAAAAPEDRALLALAPGDEQLGKACYHAVRRKYGRDVQAARRPGDVGLRGTAAAGRPLEELARRADLVATVLEGGRVGRQARLPRVGVEELKVAGRLAGAAADAEGGGVPCRERARLPRHFVDVFAPPALGGSCTLAPAHLFVSDRALRHF